MEIICAGYPKTGSKSCSAALRVLGYNVADYPETAGYLGTEWIDFLDGKTSIEPVIGWGSCKNFTKGNEMLGKNRTFKYQNFVPESLFWHNL